MATLFVRHSVADYGSWRKVYDEFEAERPSFGVTGHGVYQADGDANDVTVYHDFDTMEQAKAFAESTELKEAMSKAGVVGAPTLWFTNKV